MSTLHLCAITIIGKYTVHRCKDVSILHITYVPLFIWRKFFGPRKLSGCRVMKYRGTSDKGHSESEQRAN